jgi:hypothetical protein
MSSLRFALAAWLLGAASLAGAGVPVIELPAASGVPAAAAAGGTSASLALVGQRTPAASAPAQSGRPLPVVLPSTAAGMLVAERPKPPFGALLLLLAGCLVYLARHRGPGFALRPARELR